MSRHLYLPPWGCPRALSSTRSTSLQYSQSLMSRDLYLPPWGCPRAVSSTRSTSVPLPPIFFERAETYTCRHEVAQEQCLRPGPLQYHCRRRRYRLSGRTIFLREKMIFKKDTQKICQILANFLLFSWLTTHLWFPVQWPCCPGSLSGGTCAHYCRCCCYCS